MKLSLPLISAFIFAVLSTSCKKEANFHATSGSDSTNSSIPGANSTLAATAAPIAVGKGMGTLLIDGATLSLKCNDVIKVKGGTYSSINIQNINAGCPITIQNDGLVTMQGSQDHMQIKNVSNLTISGTGTASIAKGFVSTNNAQHRSIIINGSVHSLTIQNFSFSNIGDYVVYINNGSTVYNGSTASYSDNLKFLNIDCSNTQSFIQAPGDVVNGQITGLIKTLEVANLTFSYSNCGSVVNVGNADDYNIHNNTVTNINQTNNNHNGVFAMQGSGAFHHNLVREFQGNSLRAWTRSLGTTPKSVLIYNNTVVNSRKYSAFEVQAFASKIASGKTTYANAQVYGNICGNLSLNKEIVGVVVDVYALLGGKCQVYSNTGFNFPAPFPTSNFVSIQSSEALPTVTNNKYYATAQAAGIADVNSLKIQTTTTSPIGPITPPVTTPPPTSALNVGTGTGNLLIDGATMGLKCNDVIKVKGGTYSSINIQNINAGCPITIQNDGLVTLQGSQDHMQIKNVSNLTITGTGTASIAKGFVSTNNAQHRSITINGSVHSLTIQNFSFSNIGDYVVYINNGSTVYNGSAASYSDNLKFLNIDCSNTQSFIQAPGDVVNGQITGLIKTLEVAYLNFSYSNCGSVVNVGDADDYDIHHNTITNINQTNNNHNGVFAMQGSGSFHHNLVRDFQGNSIRAWTRSLGTTPKTVLIYNNTVVNSRKYSAFEVQAFASKIASGKTTYANAQVYNNICGNLDLSKEFVGVVVDVYTLLGGKCQVYNNTAFNFPAPFPTSNFVSLQSAEAPPVLTNNKYYATAQAAGIPDVNNLKIQQ